MHELMEKTCKALKEIEHSGSLNIMDTADRRLVSELVDLKKNLLKVEKLEAEMDGYSEAGMDYGNGSSYANRGQHYVRGHYSRDGGDIGYSSRRDGRGRYSRDDGRSEMMEHLEMAYDAATPEMREDIKRFMRKVETA